MAVTIDIKFNRANKTYCEGETVSGIVTVRCRNETRHDGLLLTVDGLVNLQSKLINQLSSKTVGVIDAFYNSTKPIKLINASIELARSGKLPAGITEVPFEVRLVPGYSRPLYETFHGVYLKVQYQIICLLRRGSIVSKPVEKSAEFIVESVKERNENAELPRAVHFIMTPDSISNVPDSTRVPSFRVKGRLDSVNCCLSRPFTGQLIVEKCDVPIQSIELQLVRIETCGCAEGYATEASEIQNIQVGDGDVTRNVAIPLYMVFPRLFTCSTLKTSNFKIEFSVNVVIIFSDERLVSERFPLQLRRN